MNRNPIKAKATEKGYTLDEETETKMKFSKGDKQIIVDESVFVITTILNGKKMYNFPQNEANLNVVTQFLLK